MRNLVAIVLFGLLNLLSTPSHGAESPEQVARNYYAALQKDGVRAIPAFLHPAEAERAKVALYTAMERDQKLPGQSLKGAIFGKAVSLEEIRSLPADQFIAKFFSGIPADLGNSLTSHDVLGSVEEQEMRHVLLRLVFNPDLGVPSKLHVITMKPYLGGWKMVLPEEFNKILTQINTIIDSKASR